MIIGRLLETANSLSFTKKFYQKIILKQQGYSARITQAFCGTRQRYVANITPIRQDVHRQTLILLMLG
jgi:hypothetical protein